MARGLKTLLKIYTTLGYIVVVYIFNFKMFHQEALVETIKLFKTLARPSEDRICGWNIDLLHFQTKLTQHRVLSSPLT